MKWQRIIVITYSTSYPFLDLITEKYRPFSDRVLYNEAGSQMDPQSYVKSSFNSVCKDKKKRPVKKLLTNENVSWDEVWTKWPDNILTLCDKAYWAGGYKGKWDAICSLFN